MPFVSIPGTFGDHSTQQVQKHLHSECHLQAVKNNKLLFRKVSSRNTNLWQLLKEASYAQRVKKHPVTTLSCSYAELGS